ncbi:LysR family transcriptional regulator [Escherichia coli]|nr:LysR family transcriptional regulator [Escherichia coli]MIL09347.1 LysR family transcriptional regulator [Salmonella enterica subsp. enterica serovar Enteritidis]
MVKKLPPLNPLKVFEVVARLKSITNASKELYVTQAAISRQIYVLEDYLQRQLFIHRRGKITITDEGRAYFEAISPCLHKIAQATEDLVKNRDLNVLHINTYQTFADYWLIPRLPKFREMHPKIELHISTDVKPVSSEDINSDIFIQFGEKSWPGHSATKILSDLIEPVCSPEFKERHGLGRDPRELAKTPLLHSNYRRRDWQDWLSSVGLEEFDSVSPPLYFRSTSLAYQAAQRGLGVAMGQLELLDQEIAEGRLVPVYDRPLPRPWGYYVLHAKSAKLRPAARQFVKWLTEITKTP